MEGLGQIKVTGQLFDTGLINQLLNIVEAENGNFFIEDLHVEPNGRLDGEAPQRSSSSARMVRGF